MVYADTAAAGHDGGRHRQEEQQENAMMVNDIDRKSSQKTSEHRSNSITNNKIIPKGKAGLPIM